MSPFRFVILRHTLPTDGPRSSHWDLMLEFDRNPQDSLLTFETHSPFESWTTDLRVSRLPNHRTQYLDYEGPISNHRGSVLRLAHGHLMWLEKSLTRFRAILHGQLSAQGSEAAPWVGLLEIYESTFDAVPVWNATWTPLARDGTVVSVSASRSHNFSKNVIQQIELLQGLGVKNDAHCGATVRHRSRVAQNPNQPNLRQVHLIHSELFAELESKGFPISFGEIGENVATLGIPLLDLPCGTILTLGQQAKVQLTGLRNPCQQLNTFRSGLTQAVLDRGPDGELIRKAGVMAIVLESGTLQSGDEIRVELPPQPHRRLERV